LLLKTANHGGGGGKNIPQKNPNQKKSNFAQKTGKGGGGGRQKHAQAKAKLNQ